MSGLSILRPLETRKHVLARTVLNLQSVVGKSNYIKFIIVGTARTGSTLLISLLNAHSQALAFGELFRSQDAIGWDVQPFASHQSPKLLALYRSDPLAFLHRNVFRRWPRRFAAVGFKLFYYHARTPPQSIVWEFLARNPDMRILHIKRRNVLGQYVSLQLAHRTGIWSSSRPTTQKPQLIELNVEECRQHFAWVRGRERECDEFFKNHDMVGVYYEDLIVNEDREMMGIQKFLGLRQEEVSTKLARQRIDSLSQLITNYDALRDAFGNTEWARFFQEPAG